MYVCMCVYMYVFIYLYIYTLAGNPEVALNSLGFSLGEVAFNSLGFKSLLKLIGVIFSLVLEVTFDSLGFSELSGLLKLKNDSSFQNPAAY